MSEVIILEENMVNIRKCAIIGCGHVGASTAYTLMLSGMFSEIVLIDKDRKKAHGEAMDITHGLPFNGPADIYDADYEAIHDAAIIIITAGANQRPGETRTDLVHKNSAIFSSIVKNICRYNREAILLVVTNPVDILTYITLEKSGYPKKRVIGSGTVLDTARLKQLIGERLGVDSRNVHSFIIGEHGDSEVPVFSSANISGVDLMHYCDKCSSNCNAAAFMQIFENVRDAAYDIIDAKGATYYGIAESVKRIVEAIVKDEHTILPVSSLLDGHYGIDDVCLGVPCIVGRGGVCEVLDIPLNSEEREKLQASARAVRSVIDELNADALV